MTLSRTDSSDYGSRAILRLALPAIVSNISVPLLGLSDTAISGHLHSTVYLAAIAVGSMMFNLVFWLFACLRMSTTGLTAQAVGAGATRATRLVLAQSLTLAGAIGLLILLCRLPLSTLLGFIISAEPDVAAAASDYFLTTALCAPAVLMQMVIAGWFIGMQNTFYPMLLAIFTNAFNIALSLTLALGADMGFHGVATGTLAANWAGLCLAVALAIRFGGLGVFSGFRSGQLMQGLGRFFRVNTDLFLRSACIMAVSLSTTAFGARLGALTLAVNAVLMQFFHFFSYFSDGFAFAAEAITGRLAGAGRRTDLLRAIRNLLTWGAGMALLFTAIYSIAPEPIVELITDRPDVTDEVMRMRLWVVVIPGLTIAAFIFDGIYIGLTATRLMLLAAAGSATIFFAVACIPYGQPADNNILWTAFMAYLTARGAILANLCKKVTSPHHISTMHRESDG